MQIDHLSILKRGARNLLQFSEIFELVSQTETSSKNS